MNARRGEDVSLASRVLRPKLRPPRLGPDRIERPRLLARLDRAVGDRVTLVAAPAGYGKTTLLSQWIARQQLPAAWLTLDAADDEVALFVEDVVASVEKVAPGSCRSTRSLLGHASLPPLELLSRELVNDLDALDEFVLVLDDCHSLRGDDTLEILRRLACQPPGSLHLILSCRAEPRLPVGSLRGRGALNEVRAADLRFSEAEAAEYLQGTLGEPLGESLLSALVERTEGWIAGLHLASLSFQGSEDIEKRILKFAGSDRFIADYLVDELLGRLDPGLREYLESTSILERLSTPLCEAVLADAGIDEVDGRPVLHWLEESNMFVVSLDDRREWFRYHHLFRELLRHSLQVTRSAEHVETLQVRAGEWLSAAGWVDDALDYFLKARRVDLACYAVERHRGRAIDEELWQTLERWNRRLGLDIVQTRPALVLIDAWLGLERQDWAAMRHNCDRAEELLDLRDGHDEDDKALRGEIAAMRTQDAYWRGDGERALLEARRALSLLPGEVGNARAMATVFEGGALHLLGRPEEASQVFHQASASDPSGRSHPRLMVGRGIQGLMMADVDEAVYAGEVMLSQAGGRGLEDSLGYAHFLLGLTAYLRDRLSVAEAHFQAVDPYASHVLSAKQAYYGLAWVRHAQGRTDEALEVMDRCERFVSDLDLPLSQEVLLLRARLTPLSGRRPEDIESAHSLVRATDAMPDIPLQVCFEFSVLSALVLLVQQGGETDLVMCEAVVRRLIGMAKVHGNTFRLIQFLVLQALLFDQEDLTAEASASLRQAVGLAKPGRLIRLFPEIGPGVDVLLRALRAHGHAEPFIEDLIAAFAVAARQSREDPPPGSSVSKRDGSVDYLLTNRELDVLELLAQRLTNKEIAKRLFISPATVKRHTLSIYGKLGVGGRREAALKGRDLGLIPGPR